MENGRVIAFSNALHDLFPQLFAISTSAAIANGITATIKHIRNAITARTPKPFLCVDFKIVHNGSGRNRTHIFSLGPRHSVR